MHEAAVVQCDPGMVDRQEVGVREAANCQEQPLGLHGVVAIRRPQGGHGRLAWRVTAETSRRSLTSNLRAKAAVKASEISLSAAPIMRSPRATSVTAVPSVPKKCASSTATAPPPTMSREPGCSGRRLASSEVR